MGWVGDDDRVRPPKDFLSPFPIKIRILPTFKGEGRGADKEGGGVGGAPTPVSWLESFACRHPGVPPDQPIAGETRFQISREMNPKRGKGIAGRGGERLFSSERNDMIQNTGPGAAGHALIWAPPGEAIFNWGFEGFRPTGAGERGIIVRE
jgi:hypothetical protein